MNARDEEQARQELLAELEDLARRLDSLEVQGASPRASTVAGAAATGAAVTLFGLAGSARAAAGPLTLGSVSNVATAPTQLDLVATVTAASALTVGDLATVQLADTSLSGLAVGTGFMRGVAGYATGVGCVGVRGISRQNPTGPTALGVAAGAEGVNAVALRASGRGSCTGAWATSPDGVGLRVESRATAAILFEPELAGRVDPVLNEVAADPGGALWHVPDVAIGRRQLSGPTTAGAFHPIDPVRVYDSRLPAPTPGTLGAGASRVISVSDARDPATGAVTARDVVPAGAGSVAFNLTVTDTTGAGFLAVAPGDATSSPSSSINWSTAGQILANGLIAKIGADRTMRVFSGGGGSTHLVIDINGYWR